MTGTYSKHGSYQHPSTTDYMSFNTHCKFNGQSFMLSYTFLYFYTSPVFCFPPQVVTKYDTDTNSSCNAAFGFPRTDIQTHTHTHTHTHILLSTHKIAFGIASIGKVPYFLDILAKKACRSCQKHKSLLSHLLLSAGCHLPSV